MATEDRTPIYLTEEEAEIFKWIWPEYESLKKAKENCKPGNILFHCNKSGEIKGREIHIY